MSTPADKPFKLGVLHTITDALKTITPTNGYVRNMADFDQDGIPRSRVYRGLLWFGADSPLPMLSVLEGVGPADEVTEPNFRAEGVAYDWPILIQGFVKDDPENPTDPAYVLMADVRQLLQSEKIRTAPDSRAQPNPFNFDLSRKNKVVGLTLGAGVARPADDVSANAYFWLSIVLRIVEHPGDPYDWSIRQP